MVRGLISRRSLGVAVAVALTQAGSAHVAGQAQRSARVIALRGATVLTVSNRGTIPNGTVLLRDGKVAAVGTGIDIPSGAEVVDVTGKFVTPGLVDAHSHIAADAINEGGTSVSAMVGIEDVLDPTDVNILRDLAGGLTTANVLHGSANPIGGKNAVIKLRWGKTRGRDLLFEGAMPGIKFALGENPKQLPRQLRAQPNQPLRYPTTRVGVEFVIRDAFTRAKAYQKAWKDYDKAKAGGAADAIPPRRDLQLEPLVEVLEGKRLVHAHTYRADETLMLIRLAEEMGFRIATFQHVLEGYRIAKEIAAHGAGGSTFSDWWGYKVEAADATPYNAAIMLRKGVLVSINSDDAELARRLNTEAAKTMKYGGLSEDEALSLVTINPAKQLRIDNRVGSLEPGKDADVTVWSAHPLSSYAVADRVYIDGTQYYDRQAEERRLTGVAKEKHDLVAAEQGSRRNTTTDTQPPNPASSAASAGVTMGRTSGPAVRDNDSSPRAQQPSLQSASAAPGQGDTNQNLTIIRNARIHPVTSATIERGAIVIRGRRIDAIYPDGQVPASVANGRQVRNIDAAGADVYPGFVDAGSNMGLDEPGPRGFDDVGELLERSPHLRTRVAYHVESDALPIARVNGVTSVAVIQSGGIFGGEVPVMNLDGWTWEEATVRANAGVQFTVPALSSGGGRGGGGRGGQQQDRTYDDLKKERDRKLDDVARLFEEVRAYIRAGAERTTDWSLDALVPVAERRLPLIVSANTEDDIRTAVALADRIKVNLVILGGAEANYVAALLKEKDVPVILGQRQTLPSREDDYHAEPYQLAGQLVKAGVKVAFSVGDDTNSRQLPYNAASSVAWGLDRDDAIKALTINAAEILGVADRIGSLQAGKDANLFIAKGDPLEIRTEVTHVFIGGRDVGLANKHLALYEKYIKRP